MNIFKQDINWPTVAYGGDQLKEINKLLTLNLRIICRKILETIPKVRAIYVICGFSRGESSVMIQNGEIKILSDIDLLVITDAPQFLSLIKLKKLKKELSTYKFFNIEIMEGHPVVEIEILSNDMIQKIPPCLFTYELKTAKCIYGVDMLDLFKKLNPNKISVRDGFRLLFDRMLGALIPFSIDLTDSKLESTKSRHLMFETSKLITACRDAILILNGIYFPTEKQRQRYFRENWSNKFTEIRQEIPWLLEISEIAHSYRLKPDERLERLSLNLWYKATYCACKIITIYLHKLYRIKGTTYDDVISTFIKRTFYPPSYKLWFILSYLKSKNPWWLHKNKILLILFSLLFSISDGEINSLILEETLKATNIKKYQIRNNRDTRSIWKILRKIVVKNYNSPFPWRAFFPMSFHYLVAEILARLKIT